MSTGNEQNPDLLLILCIVYNSRKLSRRQRKKHGRDTVKTVTRQNPGGRAVVPRPRRQRPRGNPRAVASGPAILAMGRRSNHFAHVSLRGRVDRGACRRRRRRALHGASLFFPTRCQRRLHRIAPAHTPRFHSAQAADMSIECLKGEWLLWAGISAIAMVVYGASFIFARTVDCVKCAAPQAPPSRLRTLHSLILCNPLLLHCLHASSGRHSACVRGAALDWREAGNVTVPAR